ncbi:MAG: pitrilysin family protein [Myxococcota bacterium]
MMHTIPSTITMLALIVVASACTTPPTPQPPTTPTPPAPTAPTWPQEAFRTSQPKAGPEPEVTIPKVEPFLLDNGIKVYLVEDHDLPTVTMRLRLNVGAMHDPARKEGLNNLTMELLDQGPKGVTKVAYETRKADLGARINFAGGTHTSSLTIRTLKRQLGPTLDLALEALLKPGLRKEDFARVQKRRLASLSQQLASPGSIAGRLYTSLLYGAKHPYSKLATETSLKRLNVRDCSTFARKLSPAGAELFVVGDITAEEVKSTWNPRTTKWKARGKLAKKIIPEAKPRPGTIFFVDVPGAVQSQIMVGHPGPKRQDDDYIANLMMAQILGGSFSSRINMNLREKNGFSYGARAGFSYMRTSGYFSARSSVKAETTGPALREVAKEIELMRTSAPSDEELTREIRGHVLSMPAWFATNDGVLNTFANLAFFGLPLGYFEGYQAKVMAVDKETVFTAAKDKLRNTGFTVLVVGDANTVLSDLEAIAQEGLFGPKDAKVIHLDPNGQPIKR